MTRRIPGRTTRTFGGLPYVFVWSATSDAEAKELARRIKISSRLRVLVEVVPDKRTGQWHVYKHETEEPASPEGQRRYLSDWYELSLEASKGISEESVTRLALIDALHAFSTRLMHRETPLPQTIRIEKEIQHMDLRVVLVAENEETKG